MNSLDLALIKAQFGRNKGVEKRGLDWTKFVHGKILDLQATELDHMAYTDFYHLSSSVTTLLLNDNKLTQVIYELPVLLSFVTYMNLENNCLIDLPAEFGMMERLKFLNISGNQISKLPSSFGKLKSLQCLMMEKTPLKVRVAFLLETKTKGDEGRHCAVQMRALAAQIGEARPPHDCATKRPIDGDVSDKPSLSKSALQPKISVDAASSNDRLSYLTKQEKYSLRVTPLKIQLTMSETAMQTVQSPNQAPVSFCHDYILKETRKTTWIKRFLSLPNVKLDVPDLPRSYLSYRKLKKVFSWMLRQVFWALLFMLLESIVIAVIVDIRVLENWVFEWSSLRIPMLTPLLMSVIKIYAPFQMPIQSCVTSMYGGCPLIPYVPPTWRSRLFNWILKIVSPVFAWLGF